MSLPKLNDVRGAFNLQSTKDISSACDKFNPLKNQGIIKGPYYCHGQLAKVGGTGTRTGSGSGSSASSSGAANPMLIPGATGLLGVVAAIFGVL